MRLFVHGGVSGTVKQKVPELRACLEAALGAASALDVGAVALDDENRLAAASSTGGVFGKMRGRVGDSAIFGAGFYASEQAAVVGTGVGELFMQTLACARTAMLIEEGRQAHDACADVIALLGRENECSAGLLAIDTQGSYGAAFRGGSWAVEGPDGPLEASRVA